MVAGSPPTAHLFERMESLNLRPVHVYGMSETYGPITTNYELPAWRDLPVAERCDRMARQGHGFLTSLPVRVIKPSEDGRIVNVAHDGVTIGEICFEGNICTKGYYKDPQATEKLFRGGVLHSGDLAVQHSDGSVQILDREKDVIISGGENISSVALESVLTTHPDILEVACVAVKDDIYGEVPKAYVTLRRKLEEEKDKMIIGAAILEWARSKASGSRFMMPKIIEVVSELPKTSTGKVRKNLLRDWAVARQEDVQTS
jgi:acyl-CoA synthetase (AMP-forming)/AMP-acid ligase II